MAYDRKYLTWGLTCAALGMVLGVFMGAAHDPAQHVTHAHILLAGFVVSLLYAVIHRLWLAGTLAQFIVHQAGAAIMFVGLFLLFGHVVPAAQFDPVLALSSITVLLGALLMLLKVLKTKPPGP